MKLPVLILWGYLIIHRIQILSLIYIVHAWITFERAFILTVHPWVMRDYKIARSDAAVVMYVGHFHAYKIHYTFKLNCSLQNLYTRMCVCVRMYVSLYTLLCIMSICDCLWYHGSRRVHIYISIVDLQHILKYWDIIPSIFLYVQCWYRATTLVHMSDKNIYFYRNTD